MATNTRRMHATPEQVWEVLADGWLYPLWVVGASRMREVDDHWPAVGAKLHHSVGSWPLLIDDTTEVVDVVPGSMLRLHARARPTGTAEVTIRLEAVSAETDVIIVEDAISGPGRLVPKVLRTPPLTWRNVEALRRLAYVAERRAAG
ncbi:SRPBCC family protein [Nocardioides conyzicola]|uniref:SRPBCC family protein n=1 Tax=Nocardioides conyzicola TaxID=1651781 RepID=A0ABP8X0X9_9ACTN